VTIGHIDDNNQRVEMKVPLDGFEIVCISEVPEGITEEV
jgi:hypothetical protein